MTLLKWFYPVLVVMVGAVVYANSLQNGFTFDDWPLVAQNPLVLQPHLGAIFSSAYWPDRPDLGLYRPLTTLSYALNRWVFGADPWGFHLVNVVLHIANGGLVFLGTRKILAAPYAAVCALIFLVHPLQTEAVNSIVGRAELLAAFWMLVAWTIFVYGRSRWRWQGAAFAVLLGCLCKEHAATMVGILFVADFFGMAKPQNEGPTPQIGALWVRFYEKSLVGFVWCVGAVFVFVCVRYAVVGAVLLPSQPLFIDNPLAHVSLGERLLTALGIIWRYTELMYWVRDLSADYSFRAIPLVDTLWSGFVFGGLVVLGVLLWPLVRAFKKASSVVWALATLWIVLPALPIVNLLFPIGTVMAERLMYTPMVGFALLWGICFSQVLNRWHVMLVVLCVLIGGQAYRTMARNADWQDDHTLFASAVKVMPTSAKAHFNLGNALRDGGDLEGALSHYHQALWIYPEYDEVHYNLGVIQQDLGNTSAALRAYENALAQNPKHVSVWTNVGVLFAQLDMPEKSIQAFEQAMQLDSTRVEVRFNYALALQQLDRSEQAMRLYHRVLEQNPRHEDAAINLAELYVQRGQVQRAIAVLREMVGRVDTAYQAALNLAVLLEKEGQYADALEAMLQGTKGTGERNALALFGVARLYGRLGNVEGAKTALNQFIARWPGDDRFRTRAQNMLDQLNIDQ